MNTAGAPFVQSAGFAAGDGGPRFRLVSEPATHPARGTIVFVPAFAEEMNKSRRMVARMARLLAGDAWRVVQRDLRGCGDSAGEFGDAGWEDWVEDVRTELAAAADGPVWLWCSRAGALLAAAALPACPHAGLLLWQPVLSGAQHLQQFLRLHAGARIVGSAKVDGGPSPLARLRAGEAVEVGGYVLNPALAGGLERAGFELPDGYTGHVLWFEVSAEAVPALTIPSARAIERLRERGIAIEAQVVGGPSFWQTQEIEDCDALLAATRAALADSGRPATAPRADARANETVSVYR
jgi:exosortase A-associated hydrolase 2